jgi:hypothetical protein
MLRHAISHARLMRESTDRVQIALQSPDANEQLVARRILENPAIWSAWESDHSLLMRQLANCGVRRAQVAALKHATFRLLHGKALFHYLRRSEVRGLGRAQVMAHFRPGRNYEDAVVAEHNLYLRRACSYFCVNHVGADVIEDPDFLDPIPQYEQLYTEYFNVYCSSLVATPDADALSQQALLPLLKKQLNEYRWAILDPRRAQPFLRREVDLRRPTGDTQRLPTLNGRPGRL